MTQTLSQVSLAVSEALSWLADFTTTISSTPLLLILVVVPFFGIGVTLLKRLTNL